MRYLIGEVGDDIIICDITVDWTCKTLKKVLTIYEVKYLFLRDFIFINTNFNFAEEDVLGMVYMNESI
jgi:hypothetical protein